MVVDSRDGGYLRNVAGVNPGKGGKYPRLIAVSNVESGGENRAAWLKATRSPGVLEFDWCVTASAVEIIASCSSASRVGWSGAVWSSG